MSILTPESELSNLVPQHLAETFSMSIYGLIWLELTCQHAIYLSWGLRSQMQELVKKAKNAAADADAATAIDDDDGCDIFSNYLQWL